MVSRSYKDYFLWSVKWLVSIAIFVLIYYKLFINTDDSGERFFSSTFQKSIESLWSYQGVFWMTVLLSFVNWALEALKWKKLIQKIEECSFWFSYKSVLTGLSISFLTPRSVGDYFGRIFHMRSKERMRVVGALVMSGISQLFITVLFGVSGVFYFVYLEKTSLGNDGVNLIIILLVLVMIVLALVFRKAMLNYLFKITQLKRVERLFTIIKGYDNREMFVVILISLIRYMVFTFQFVLVMYYFFGGLPVLELFFSIAVMFFIKSVFMSFNFLSDLGVRGAAAMFISSILLISFEQVLAISLIIWLVNVLLPTVIGSFFVLQLKLR